MRITLTVLSALLAMLLAVPALAQVEIPAELQEDYAEFLRPEGPVASDVLYFVPDQAAAAAHYEKLLGFPFVFDEEGGPTFLMVDEHITLGLLDVHEFGPPGWKEGDPLPAAALGYQVADGAAEAERMSAMGAYVQMVADREYISVWVVLDPTYNHTFVFTQWKDSDMARQVFLSMQRLEDGDDDEDEDEDEDEDDDEN